VCYQPSFFHRSMRQYLCLRDAVVHTAHYSRLVTLYACCMYVIMRIPKFCVQCDLCEQLLAIVVIMCDMNCTVKFNQRSEVKVVMHSSAQQKTKVTT
jgi:hypothetical protein